MLIFNRDIIVNKNPQTSLKNISSVLVSKGTRTPNKKFKRSAFLTEENKRFLKSLGLTLRNE